MALVRAVARPDLPVPVWPDLDGNGLAVTHQQTGWLRTVWADDRLAQALGLASPVLADRVARLTAAPQPDPREVRRAVRSTARYHLRRAGRPTPFGYFAGVQAASFGPSCDLRWGDGHHVVPQASATRLARAIEQLEHLPAMLANLDVTPNNTVPVRGDRLGACLSNRQPTCVS
ncbi:lantibiotic dehydratase [Kitasatospora sp. NPDC001159]